MCPFYAYSTLHKKLNAKCIVINYLTKICISSNIDFYLPLTVTMNKELLNMNFSDNSFIGRIKTLQDIKFYIIVSRSSFKYDDKNDSSAVVSFVVGIIRVCALITNCLIQITFSD